MLCSSLCLFAQLHVLLGDSTKISDDFKVFDNMPKQLNNFDFLIFTHTLSVTYFSISPLRIFYLLVSSNNMYVQLQFDAARPICQSNTLRINQIMTTPYTKLKITLF